MIDDISPEERLFKIIQEAKSSGTKPMPSKKRQRQALVTDKNKELDLALVNRSFAVLLALLLAWAFYYAAGKRLSVDDTLHGLSKIKPAGIRKKSVEEFKPLYFYTDQVGRRDIFSLYERNASGVASGMQRLKLLELTSDLNLVGIYMGPYPEAMIESKSDQKTYFLKKGDEIKGLKIKEILADRVIFEYQGEEMEFM